MFLEANDFKPTSITMSNIKQWATDVCQNHLQGGADPTDSLCKIAQANSLTPPQIEVLAGEINKTIHIAKYASAEDKYHAADFPLADSRKAVLSLQQPTHSEKLAFAIPEPQCGANQNFDFFGAFGVEEDTQIKVASAAEVRGVEEKLAAMKRKQDDSDYLSKVACQNAELGFIKEARQMVLDGLNSQDRMKKFANVVHAVKCSDMYEIARKPLAKLAHVLGAECLIDRSKVESITSYILEKSADVVAPQELVSEFLQAKVVNGNHPLLVTLKTYADAEERAKSESFRTGIIDNKDRIFKQKIRGL